MSLKSGPKRKASDDDTIVEPAIKRLSTSKIEIQLNNIWNQVPVFPLGIENTKPEMISKHPWQFTNLQEAFNVGGVLNGAKKVFLFCSSQAIDNGSNVPGQSRLSFVPVVFAIVSSVVPFDKVLIHETLKDFKEDVMDMQKANLTWAPCIIQGSQSVSSHGKPVPEISVLSYIQTVVTSGNMLQFSPTLVCSPFFINPYKVDERKHRTEVDIEYLAGEKTINKIFDWETHTLPLALYTDILISDEGLPEDHRDGFQEFLKQKIEEGKRAHHEAMQKHMQEVEDLRMAKHEEAAAFDNMKFYKFYPIATPDTPVLSGDKRPHAGLYDGDAHGVF